MNIIYFQCLFHSGVPVRISETENLNDKFAGDRSSFKDETRKLEKMTGSRLFVKRVRFTSYKGQLQIDIASVENHRCRALQALACDVLRARPAGRLASSNGSDAATWLQDPR